MRYFVQLHVTEDRFLENIFAVLKYLANYNQHKLRKPVDKDKWSIAPAVVNAFYDPNKNEIGKTIVLLLISIVIRFERVNQNKILIQHCNRCFLYDGILVFPAGILQPLFFSPHFPKSLNYGGIGVVIGHEITHGFDDRGRQYDKHGNMMQWWNNVTIKAFRERAQCIVNQYSKYKLEEVNQFVDGRMTEGENIADNGGLKQSFRVIFLNTLRGNII